MKRLFALAGLVLAALVVPARAQSPDDQYVLIYSVIQEADALNNLDQPAQALPKFLEAQSALQRLQKQFPDWHEKVVGFRLNYLAAKIAAVTNKVTTATAAITTKRPTRRCRGFAGSVVIGGCAACRGSRVADRFSTTERKRAFVSVIFCRPNSGTNAGNGWSGGVFYGCGQHRQRA